MSACTMVLSVFPRDRICVTKTGALGFHAARWTDGPAVAVLWITDVIEGTYPPDIKNWIVANRATDTLTITMLRGKELQTYVKRCEPKLYASIDARRKTPWPQAKPLTPKSLRAIFPPGTTRPAISDLKARLKLLTSDVLKPGLRACKKVLGWNDVVRLAGFSNPAKTPPIFNADKIAALLDKRDPPHPQQSPEVRLSPEEIDAFRTKLMAVWNPPVVSADTVVDPITVRIKLAKNGQLSEPPIVLTEGKGALFEALRESAIRAVFMAQPYKMFKEASYKAWNEIEMTFDSRSRE